MESVREFLSKLTEKEREKVLFNIKKARFVQDKNLLKKLSGDIWEFRTLFGKKKIRVLAFWDKRDKKDTLVICSNAFVKKTGKVPGKEINKAINLMKEYFDNTG